MNLEDGLILGAGVLAHVGILANRYIVRPKLKNKKYSEISIQVEHVLHHVAQTLMFNVIFKNFPGTESLENMPYKSMIASFGAGLYVDGIIPQIKDGRPQLDQITSNSVGVLMGGGIIKYLL